MKSYLMKRLGSSMVGLMMLLLLPLHASAETLMVYTAVEAEDLKRYAAAFNKDHPDIKIRWVRDSTGIVTAKLLAEKNNPRADVIWGLAATSLMLLKSEGMLQAYSPKGVDKLDPKFRDAANPPSWTGMDAWIAAVCVNTVEAQRHNLPTPTSWMDLTDPVYKGHLVMPNPNSINNPETGDPSGVAYIDDFEGAKRTTSFPIQRRFWKPSSPPLIYHSNKTLSHRNRAKMYWYNPYVQWRTKDIWPIKKHPFVPKMKQLIYLL